MESIVVRREGLRTRMILACLLFGTSVVIGPAGGQTPVPAIDPGKLGARDDHQGLLIAADPYLTSERSEQQFGKKHPYGVGILAVDVYLQNNSESPIRVVLSTMAMEVRPPGGSRQKIESLSTEEAAERMVFPQPINPTITRLPLPPSHGAVKKNKDVEKMEKSLAPRTLGDLVGPHATIHGFVFFDLAYHFDWVEKSTLYVPDVRRINPEEKLLFFELDLKPASK